MHAKAAYQHAEVAHRLVYMQEWHALEINSVARLPYTILILQFPLPYITVTSHRLVLYRTTMAYSQNKVRGALAAYA